MTPKVEGVPVARKDHTSIGLTSCVGLFLAVLECAAWMRKKARTYFARRCAQRLPQCGCRHHVGQNPEQGKPAVVIDFASLSKGGKKHWGSVDMKS